MYENLSVLEKKYASQLRFEELARTSTRSQSYLDITDASSILAWLSSYTADLEALEIENQPLQLELTPNLWNKDLWSTWDVIHMAKQNVDDMLNLLTIIERQEYFLGQDNRYAVEIFGYVLGKKLVGSTSNTHTAYQGRFFQIDNHTVVVIEHLMSVIVTKIDPSLRETTLTLVITKLLENEVLLKSERNTVLACCRSGRVITLSDEETQEAEKIAAEGKDGLLKVFYHHKGTVVDGQPWEQSLNYRLKNVVSLDVKGAFTSFVLKPVQLSVSFDGTPQKMERKKRGAFKKRWRPNEQKNHPISQIRKTCRLDLQDLLTLTTVIDRLEAKTDNEHVQTNIKCEIMALIRSKTLAREKVFQNTSAATPFWTSLTTGENELYVFPHASAVFITNIAVEDKGGKLQEIIARMETSEAVNDETKKTVRLCAEANTIFTLNPIETLCITILSENLVSLQEVRYYHKLSE